MKLTRFLIQDIDTLLAWLDDRDESFLTQFAGTKYRHPLTQKQILDEMNLAVETGNHLYFKYSDESEITGHCQLMRIDRDAQCASIGRVIVDPEARGRGLGRCMLQELIGFTRDKMQIKELNLNVFDFNSSAIKCYKSLGFVEESRQVVEMKNIGESWVNVRMVLQVLNQGH